MALTNPRPAFFSRLLVIYQFCRVRYHGSALSWTRTEHIRVRSYAGWYGPNPRVSTDTQNRYRSIHCTRTSAWLHNLPKRGCAERERTLKARWPLRPFRGRTRVWIGLSTNHRCLESYLYRERRDLEALIETRVIRTACGAARVFQGDT